MMIIIMHKVRGIPVRFHAHHATRHVQRRARDIDGNRSAAALVVCGREVLNGKEQLNLVGDRDDA